MSLLQTSLSTMQKKEKSFEFSLIIIKLYQKMIDQNEYVLSKQLLRSGTSIGANIEEATAGGTKEWLMLKEACRKTMVTCGQWSGRLGKSGPPTAEEPAGWVPYPRGCGANYFYDGAGRLQAAERRDLDMYSGTGTSHSVVSGRLVAAIRSARPAAIRRRARQRRDEVLRTGELDVQVESLPAQRRACGSRGSSTLIAGPKRHNKPPRRFKCQGTPIDGGARVFPSWSREP